MAAFTNDRVQRQTSFAEPVHLLEVRRTAKQKPARRDSCGDRAEPRVWLARARHFG